MAPSSGRKYSRSLKDALSLSLSLPSGRCEDPNSAEEQFGNEGGILAMGVQWLDAGYVSRSLWHRAWSPCWQFWNCLSPPLTAKLRARNNGRRQITHPPALNSSRTKLSLTTSTHWMLFFLELQKMFYFESSLNLQFCFLEQPRVNLSKLLKWRTFVLGGILLPFIDVLIFKMPFTLVPPRFLRWLIIPCSQGSLLKEDEKYEPTKPQLFLGCKDSWISW